MLTEPLEILRRHGKLAEHHATCITCESSVVRAALRQACLEVGHVQVAIGGVEYALVADDMLCNAYIPQSNPHEL